MKARSRKVVAVLALAAGLWLLVSEYARIGEDGSWFWILIAALVVILALWELFSSGPGQEP